MDMIGMGELRQAWRQRRQLPDVEERVLREAFHLIRGGRVATDAALAAHTGLSSEAVRTALAALQEAGQIVREVDTGDVVGAFGLSLLPTPHALSLDGRQLFTWCALDAAGIPAGLAVDATVRSQCVTCQQPLTIVYTAGTVTQALQTGICLWVSTPEVGHSVVGDTWPVINFFCSGEHVGTWFQEQTRRRGTAPVGRVLTLTEAASLGREVWGAADRKFKRPFHAAPPAAPAPGPPPAAMPHPGRWRAAQRAAAASPERPVAQA